MGLLGIDQPATIPGMARQTVASKQSQTRTSSFQDPSTLAEGWIAPCMSLIVTLNALYYHVIHFKAGMTHTEAMSAYT